MSNAPTGEIRFISGPRLYLEAQRLMFGRVVGSLLGPRPAWLLTALVPAVLLGVFLAAVGRQVALAPEAHDPAMLTLGCAAASVVALVASMGPLLWPHRDAVPALLRWRMGSLRLHATAAGLEIGRGPQVDLLPWRLFDDITEHGTAVAFWLGPLPVAVVPRAAFSGPAEARRFTHRARVLRALATRDARAQVR
ncbi:MAG: hypothetical protein ACQEXJ_06790 [Myxococcota bacterium]